MVEHREAYERLHGPGPHDAEFFNGYVRTECPRCGSVGIVSRGSDARVLRRWSCKECGCTFTPVTGTIIMDGARGLCFWPFACAAMCPPLPNKNAMGRYPSRMRSGRLRRVLEISYPML